MNKILLPVRYFLHISTIRKNPNGFVNRHQPMDDFIASQEYSKIKTYKDFIYDEEMMKQRVYINENDQRQIFGGYQRHRKGAVWTKRLIRPLERKDDKEIEEEYEHKNLFTFTKQAIKQKQAQHRFYLACIYGIIVNSLTYFLFFYGQESKGQETVRAAGVERAQIYYIKQCSISLVEFDKKIKIYMDECRKIAPH